jgi:hypothetical protein
VLDGVVEGDQKIREEDSVFLYGTNCGVKSTSKRLSFPLTKKRKKNVEVQKGLVVQKKGEWKEQQRGIC